MNDSCDDRCAAALLAARRIRLHRALCHGVQVVAKTHAYTRRCTPMPPQFIAATLLLPAAQVYLLIGYPSSRPVAGLFQLPKALHRSLITTVTTSPLCPISRAGSALAFTHAALPMLKHTLCCF